MNSHVTNEAGFTIVEVLVSVVLFMIAFVTIVSLFDSVLNRMSVKEIRTANELAEEFIQEALTTPDTTSFDSTIVVNTISFEVQRTIEIVDGLKTASVVVSRLKTGKKLIELYDAVVTYQE